MPEVEDKTALRCFLAGKGMASNLLLLRSAPPFNTVENGSHHMNRNDGSAPSADRTTPRREPAWRNGLPTLTDEHVTLRELERADAASLFALLTANEVARFISPPPSDVEGFERFVAWAHRQREAGRYVCFAVVPPGQQRAVGLIQIRQLDLDWQTAEWGFAIGSEYWGTGIFPAAAHLTVDFAIETVGVHRLEARAAVMNGRGNGALRKVGAVRELRLRRSFLRRGKCSSQFLWSILDTEWRDAKARFSWSDAVAPSIPMDARCRQLE